MPLSVLRGYQEPGKVWRDQDGLLAAALIEYEADLCSGCGHPLSETTDTSANPFNADGTHRYEAPLPTRCYSCEVLQNRAEQYRETDTPAALKFGTRRVPRVAGRR